MWRVAPRFSIPPDPYYEVMSGSDLNITCVAVGSPMPYVKWKKDQDDVLPEGSTTPIGKNVLELAGKENSRVKFFLTLLIHTFCYVFMIHIESENS